VPLAQFGDVLGELGARRSEVRGRRAPVAVGDHGDREVAEGPRRVLQRDLTQREALRVEAREAGEVVE
jgi:hypothetical protein